MFHFATLDLKIKMCSPWNFSAQICILSVTPLYLVHNILPVDKGCSWMGFECVIRQINRVGLKSTLQISTSSFEVQVSSNLWLQWCIKGAYLFQSPWNLTCGERKVVFSFLPTPQACFISFSYFHSHPTTQAVFCIAVLWFALHKMVCLGYSMDEVNKVLTRLDSHPPSSPSSKQSSCANSIFLLTLLNKWLQLTAGENLWNKKRPPEITGKPTIMYLDRENDVQQRHSEVSTLNCDLELCSFLLGQRIGKRVLLKI